MKLKRIATLSIAAVLAVTALTGCGKDKRPEAKDLVVNYFKESSGAQGYCLNYSIDTDLKYEANNPMLEFFGLNGKLEASVNHEGDFSTNIYDKTNKTGSTYNKAKITVEAKGQLKGKDQDIKMSNSLEDYTIIENGVVKTYKKESNSLKNENKDWETSEIEMTDVISKEYESTIDDMKAMNDDFIKAFENDEFDEDDFKLADDTKKFNGDECYVVEVNMSSEDKTFKDALNQFKSKALEVSKKENSGLPKEFDAQKILDSLNFDFEIKMNLYFNVNDQKLVGYDMECSEVINSVFNSFVNAFKEMLSQAADKNKLPQEEKDMMLNGFPDIKFENTKIKVIILDVGTQNIVAPVK